MTNNLICRVSGSVLYKIKEFVVGLVAIDAEGTGNLLHLWVSFITFLIIITFMIIQFNTFMVGGFITFVVKRYY